MIYLKTIKNKWDSLIFTNRGPLFCLYINLPVVNPKDYYLLPR